MALEIKITPVLQGPDAERFLELLEKPTKSKLTRTKKAAIRKRTMEILKKANF